MQGGLVQPAGSGTGQYHIMGAGSQGPPQATGAPAVPAATGDQQVVGRGPGVTSRVSVAEMGPVDRLLAGTSLTQEDIDLILQAISTAVLLYWGYTEVTG